MRHYRFQLTLFIAVLIIMGACGPGEKTLFTKISADETGIHFSNDLEEDEEYNILTNEYIYNGGGVAAGDINNDGLPDLYFTGNTVTSRLYLNLGNARFRDITDSANVRTNRWATGVLMADINQDGYTDIYVSCAGSADLEKRRNYLFLNNGDLTFREAAEESGLADTGYTTHSALLDYDRDGDLDLFLLNHANKDRNPSNIVPQAKDGSGASTDKLFRNYGGKFTDVSAEAGILTEGYGLGIAVTDVNSDGWPDIYIANDYVYNDILYINQKNGTFRDELHKYMRHTSHFAMGADAADLNNDALTDIVVADMLPPNNYREKILAGPMGYDRFQLTLQQGYVAQYMRNTLQLNNGNGTFSEIGQLAGIAATDWSWSPLIADFDNDGWNDIFFSNGYLKNITDRDFQMYSSAFYEAQIGPQHPKSEDLRKILDTLKGAPVSDYLFRNNGDLTFTDVSAASGLSENAVTHGALYCDIDRDGDLDLVVNNQNTKASVYRNTTNGKRNFLQVSFRGDSLNRQGIGTNVSITTTAGTQRQENFLSRGYQSSREPTLHFGLGKDTVVSVIEITWPDGKQQILKNVRANQMVVADYRQSRQVQRFAAKETAFFEVIPSHSMGVAYRHRPTTHIDFKSEPLLPYTLSRSAPCAAAADVNGDGLTDFYVGATTRQEGKLFLQISDGTFMLYRFPAGTPAHETDAVFFDADQDGDQDLYITAGGNEFYPGSSQYRDRFFKNDGAGNFTAAHADIPAINSSTGCVAAADIDGDGDQDLFVGGMVEPMKYPLPPDSYIYINEGGRFRNETARWFPEFRRFALVKAATWTDLNRDNRPDLIVAAEYAGIRIYINKINHLEDETNNWGMEGQTGWWRALYADDFDNDGDTDILAGNIGLNTPFQVSEKFPLTMVANDFDNNGSFDAITGYYRQGKLYPAASRNDLLEQIPSYKKKFLYHRNYAQASLPQVVGEKTFRESYVLKANEMRSVLFRNTGSSFAALPLPLRFQFAPVTSVVKLRAESEGQNQYLLTGNDYTPEVSKGQYDAFPGAILGISGQSNPVFISDKGLKLSGHNGKAQVLETPRGRIFIIPVLNDSIVFLQMTKFPAP